MKTLYIITGEASGDFLGAELIKSLRKKDSTIQIIGIGGPLIEEQGLKSLFPMSEFSLMGLFEILPQIWMLLKRVSQTVDHIIETQPDAVITIDSPGFCKRVVRLVKKRLKKQHIEKNIKFYHYVAPSVWAWRPKRAKKIAKLVDHLFCLLPFEPPYFHKHGLKATFIGHQLVSDIDRVNNEKEKNCFNVLLLPGSRKSEINTLLQTFLNVVKRIQKEKLFDKPVRFLLPTLPHLKEMVADTVVQNNLQKEVEIVIDHLKKDHLFSNAHFALAASGTVSLELAKFRIPHIIAYKVNFFTAFILRFLITTEYKALPNILAKKEIVPECIQEKCTEDYIFEQFKKIIKNNELSSELHKAFLQISPPSDMSSSMLCADVILGDIKNRQ